MERVIRVRIEQRDASAKGAPVVQVHEFLIPRTMNAETVAVVATVNEMEVEVCNDLLLGANEVKENNEEWVWK